MKIRLCFFSLICFILIVAYSPSAYAAYSEHDHLEIYIDGESVYFSDTPIIINNTTYVPIRAFCLTMGAEEINWLSEKSIVSVQSSGLHLEASLKGRCITANDRCLYVPNGCIMKNDCVMVPIRILVAAFDADIMWDESSFSIYITSGCGAIASGDNFYDDTDLYWLSRIIHAEANGESLEGKIAVGNVIQNRVASSIFPNTIYEVIFDNQYGIQFSPAYSGSIYCTPSAESVQAAKIALEGYNTAFDSLFFSSNAVSCWAAKNRPYVTQIGNHYFYA